MKASILSWVFVCFSLATATVSPGQVLEIILETPSENVTFRHIDYSGGTVMLGGEGKTIWVGDLETLEFSRYEWEGYSSQSVNFVHAHNTDTLFASIGHKIKRSFNRGQSWEEIGQLGRVSKFVSLSNTTLLAASGDGIHRSTDLGNTWSDPSPQMSEDPYRAGSIFQITDSILVAAKIWGMENHGSYEFWSFDQGETWSDSTEASARGGGIRIAASDSTVAILMKSDGWRTYDLDNMATIQNTLPYCESFSAALGAFFCAATGGLKLLSSFDSGQTWSQVGDGEIPAYSLSAISRDSVLVGTKNAIYLVKPSFATSISKEEVRYNISDCSPFPNPFKEMVSFCFPSNVIGQTEVQVFDLLGRRVVELKSTICNSSVCRFEWRPESIVNGVYILVATDGNSVFRSSVVKAN